LCDILQNPDNLTFKSDNDIHVHV